MTEKEGKATPRSGSRPADTRGDRRARQAQALRRNLLRRKAQQRNRAADDGPKGAATDAEDGPTPE